MATVPVVAATSLVMESYSPSGSRFLSEPAGTVVCVGGRKKSNLVACHCSVDLASAVQFRFGTINVISSAFMGSPFTRLGLVSSFYRRSLLHSSPTSISASADFYATLGVSESADKAEIKSAYRRLARQYHPDVNKEDGAEQKFKDISNAYEVLQDDEKRALYDRFGEAGLKGAGQGGPGDFNNPFDLFETFFGGMGGMGGRGSSRQAKSRPIQGDDERYDLLLDFKDAVFGTDKDIEVTRLESCNTCSGSGKRPGTKATTCDTCGGQGQVVSTAQTPLGDFRQVATCPACGGSGEISTPCLSCRGDGRMRKSKRISIKVPAGVDSGSRLRVRSEGNAGRRGGPPGDLYVLITVRGDPELKRDGNNILISCKVSYIDAILGTTVKVTTVDGTVDLKIPSGTQPGTTLVMARRGVPRLGKTNLRGDQLVRVQVEIPKRLSGDERKLIEELANFVKPKPASSRT